MFSTIDMYIWHRGGGKQLSMYLGNKRSGGRAICTPRTAVTAAISTQNLLILRHKSQTGHLLQRHSTIMGDAEYYC